MNEEPKNIWKKPLPLSKLLLLWLGLLLLVALILTVIALGDHTFALLPILIAGMVGATFLLGLYLFSRWVCCWRNFRRFVFGCACLLTLIALVYAGEDWRGKQAWETYKREWAAKGENFDRQAMFPPAVPADQNFALTPLVYTAYGWLLTRDGKTIPRDQRDTNFVRRIEMPIVPENLNWPTNENGNWEKARLTDLKPWQDFYRSLANTTNRFPVAPQPQTPAQDVLLALSKYDSTVEELRADARLPYSRFPLEYDKDDPAAILLPHLAALKQCAQLLRLRALAELQNGESNQALADIKLTLRLAEAVRTEPILISHLVRVAMMELALQPIYEGLAAHQWSDTQLAELDSTLTGLDFLADYSLSLHSELVLFQGGAFDYLRRHPAELPDLTSYTDNQTSLIPPPFLCHLIPQGWFYQNQLVCGRALLEYYLPPVDVTQAMVFPAKADAADAAVEQETKHLTPYNALEPFFIPIGGRFLPSFGDAILRFTHEQTAVNLARVAMALERYRLAHGEYPQSLETLAPAYLDKVPHDIIGGQPLHYRRTTDGQFVLYSVGWNETDDGGVVVLGKNSTSEVNLRQGDWVWRYPEK